MKDLYLSFLDIRIKNVLNLCLDKQQTILRRIAVESKLKKSV